MRMVSSIVSPLVAEEVSAAFSADITLPPSRSIALSNERRVRVDGSKKSEASILPRSDSSRSPSSEEDSLKSAPRVSRVNCCVSIRCCIRKEYTPEPAVEQSRCEGMAPTRLLYTGDNGRVDH